MTPPRFSPWRTAAACLALTLGAPAAISQVPDQFPERLELLKERLEAARVDSNVPGFGFALINRDGILWSGGFGVVDLESGEPATDESLFAIGSTTKSFTAALAGSYVEEAAFDWDTPASELLPVWQLKGKGGQTITMRDLLSHRTGYPRMGLLFITGKAKSDRILEVANGAKPLHGYHEQFLYNNIQYLAAGEATAAVGDAEWERLLEIRLTDRLGMTSTTGAFARVASDRRTAQGYKWEDEDELHEAMPARNISNCAPAGSLYSNARDMSRWMQFQLNRGSWNGVQILDAATIEECWEPNIQIAPGVDYGMGWMVSEFAGQRMVEHGGNIDGYSASIGMLPDSGYAYVMLCNLDGAPIQGQVPSLVFDTLINPLPSDSATNAEDFSPFLGEYIADFGQWSDETFTVLDKDGTLAVDIPGQMVFELHDPQENGHRAFKLTDTIEVSFEQDANGQVTTMRLHQGGLDMEFPRRGVEIPIEIPLARLNPFLGAYRLAAANQTWTVQIKNNRLAVDVPGEMIYELRAPDADGWRSFRVKDEFKVTFDRDDDGAITQLRFSRSGTEMILPRLASDEAEGVTLAEVYAAMRLGQRQAKVDAWQGYTSQANVFVEQAGIHGSAVFSASNDGRYYSEVTFGEFGEAESVMTSEGGWTRSDFEPFDEYSMSDRQEALEGAAYAIVLGDMRQHYDEIYLDRETEFEGTQYWVLKATYADRPEASFYVNQETGLIDRFDYAVVFSGGGSLPIEAYLKDYRMIDGVQVPFTLEVVNQASGRVIQEITEFSPGVAPKESQFQMPAEK